MTHEYFSIRTGINKNTNGLDLDSLKELILRVYDEFVSEGYFDEQFGFWCVDEQDVPGQIKDIELEILLKIRKRNLWPIREKINTYSEDDLFDIIEFLHQNVSKPIDGEYHNYNQCGMHWHTFNKKDGQAIYREKINLVLDLYKHRFELSEMGELLHKSKKGFEQIFKADIPTKDENITSRIESSILSYRRHGATLDDRRNAVRDLSDVLEYLRQKVKGLITKEDENDLFNLANNFGIRHHNDKQKTNYDAALWLSWMFYYYLATIHVLLRKMEKET